MWGPMDVGRCRSARCASIPVGLCGVRICGVRRTCDVVVLHVVQAYPLGLVGSVGPRFACTYADMKSNTCGICCARDRDKPDDGFTRFLAVLVLAETVALVLLALLVPVGTVRLALRAARLGARLK